MASSHFASVTAGRSFGTRTGDDGTEQWETTYFCTTAVLKEKPLNYDRVFNEIASIVLESSADVGDKDVLVINLTYGYDIGISRSWYRQTKRYAPEVWRMKLMRASDKTDV